jgi:hypothetical protein
MTRAAPVTHVSFPLLVLLLLSIAAPRAWALTYDPVTATPWVQAKVEGSVPTAEQIGTSTATATSSSEAGSGSAILDAALGNLQIHNQTNFDSNSVGARTVVEWDYFTIHGITDVVSITSHFQITGTLHASAKTKRSSLYAALDYESEYGANSNRPQWVVGNLGNIESGLLTVNHDQTQAITLSDTHPDFRLRYSLIGSATHAGSWVNAAGQLSFDLPDGAWITSKAGFLAPVPEPHTWAMLLAGLGLVGWATQRRQEPRH